MSDQVDIRQMRRDLGLSQIAVAKAARIPRSRLSLLENGATERARVLTTLRAIAAERDAPRD